MRLSSRCNNEWVSQMQLADDCVLERGEYWFEWKHGVLKLSMSCHKFICKISKIVKTTI